MDYYEWHDPFAAIDKIPALERRAREQFSSGVAAGQADLARILNSPLRDGLERGARALGEKVMSQPEVSRAVNSVIEGVAQRAKIEVRHEDRPELIERVTIQTVRVDPFVVSYGMAYGVMDLERGRWS